MSRALSRFGVQWIADFAGLLFVAHEADRIESVDAAGIVTPCHGGHVTTEYSLSLLCRTRNSRRQEPRDRARGSIATGCGLGAVLAFCTRLPARLLTMLHAGSRESRGCGPRTDFQSQILRLCSCCTGLASYQLIPFFDDVQGQVLLAPGSHCYGRGTSVLCCRPACPSSNLDSKNGGGQGSRQA